MKKSRLCILALLTVFGLGLSSSRAGWSLSDWLEKMDRRLSRADERYNQQYAAVAAVRGAKTENNAATLYWKGKRAPVTREEFDAFKAAVALARDKKPDQAQAAFESFLKNYPASPLSPDARETLTLLTQTPPSPSGQ
jgi:TolA-binding protein